MALPQEYDVFFYSFFFSEGPFFPSSHCFKDSYIDEGLSMMQVKAWAKLLNTFCTSGKLELELMYKVQIQCYEDAKLMKLFPEIVRSLYDQDVLAEDTILAWFRRGTNPKGRYACSFSAVD